MEEASYLPDGITEDTGVVEINKGIPEIERRLGI